MNFKGRRYEQEPNIALEFTAKNLSESIYIVNKHAKTATDPKFLYELKKSALEKMLEEGKAEKVGLHFSRNPKFSQQQSVVLIVCGEYLFHLPPIKEDFQNLPHLGHLSDEYRNPKTYLSLRQAKNLLITYTGISKPKQSNPYFFKLINY